MVSAVAAFFGGLAIISALGVIVQRNPVHSLLSLIVTLISIAALFIAEDATVVGLLQIIVYAGAIMVLFLFVIWLLNLQAEAQLSGHLALKLGGSIAASAFAAEMYAILARPHLLSQFTAEPPGFGSIDSLAPKLFTDYLVAFEAASILLLVAVVGAVAMARRLPSAGERKPSGEEQAS
ncbi:MAG TPA: NADH-quinone oxidoreductase subunit J [Candidatus Binataceae bacterium]|nr:NADH-quinone oxidoreductase subunit J [Candidatus Binataceae bacterium]